MTLRKVPGISENMVKLRIFTSVSNIFQRYNLLPHTNVSP